MQTGVVNADGSVLVDQDSLNRLIVSSGHDCLLVLSLDGRIQQLSDAACALLEVADPGQLKLANWLSIWEAPERASVRDALNGARTGNTMRFSAFGYTLKRKPKWWDTVVSPILGDDGKVTLLLAVSRDITELHLREQQIRELNAQLEQRVEQRTQDLIRTNYQLHNALLQVNDLYDHAPCGYLSLDVKGRFEAVNQTALGWLGLTRKDVLGQLQFRTLLHEADQPRFDLLYSWLLAGHHTEEQEYEIHRNDGTCFTALLNVGSVLDFEGRFVNCRMSMVDITARREAENALQRINSDLERANAELESFSYTVSHDLRAPLRHLNHYIDLGREAADLGNTQAFLPCLDQMDHSVCNMGRLIDRLLDLARLGRTALQEMPFDMGGLVAEAVQAAASEAAGGEAGRRIEWVIAPDFPQVHCDPILIRQVWSNLLSNALKYSRTRALARIELGWRRVDARQGDFFVTDNGVGFDPGFRDKLFGMFQRLHSATEFEGTGIGLALTRKIVERHGGSIAATGEKDVGCTICFTLPLAGPESAGPGGAPSP